MMFSIQEERVPSLFTDNFCSKKFEAKKSYGKMFFGRKTKKRKSLCLPLCQKGVTSEDVKTSFDFFKLF